MLKYAVIGSGAIGGYFGAKLARSGKQVDFLFHSDYEYVKKNGLQINSTRGSFHLADVSAYKSAADMPVADVVLVGLKTTNNHLLKEMLPPLLHPDTLVILIQNGLGVEEDLAQDLPGVHIAGGLAFIASSKESPGTVLHQDLGRITIASYGQGDEGLLQQVCDDLNNADVRAKVAPDLASARWRKLQWNIPFNGLSVVLNTTTDKILTVSETYTLAEDLMREVALASQACGVPNPVCESDIEKMMEMTRRMPPYAPSMKLDYDYHRPMEVKYIYHRPVEVARVHGFEMKKTEMLGQLLEFLA